MSNARQFYLLVAKRGGGGGLVFNVWWGHTWCFGVVSLFHGMQA